MNNRKTSGICKVFSNKNKYICSSSYIYEYQDMKSLSAPITYGMNGFIYLNENVGEGGFFIELEDGVRLMSYGNDEKRWATSITPMENIYD